MASGDRSFFFSAGPDRKYLTRQDNLYSYESDAIAGARITLDYCESLWGSRIASFCKAGRARVPCSAAAPGRFTAAHGPSSTGAVDVVAAACRAGSGHVGTQHTAIWRALEFNVPVSVEDVLTFLGAAAAVVAAIAFSARFSSSVCVTASALSRLPGPMSAATGASLSILVPQVQPLCIPA